MQVRVIATIAVALLLAGCATAPRPTLTAGPTAALTAAPTSAPTVAPTAAPTAVPTAALTAAPTAALPTATPAAVILAPAFPPSGMILGTAASPRVIEITADDALTFFPNVVQVVQGETINFKITNVGAAVHEFMLGSIDAAFADAAADEVADIAQGETKSLTFTFDGPGPYAFACHAPGHFEAGMLGYVLVVGSEPAPVGTADNPRLVAIEMNDHLQFVPNQIEVTQGETVTFLVTNTGTAIHELAIGPADKVDADDIDGVIVKEVDQIEGHHLKTVTYTFDGSGPYAFACHEPGHFEAGMRGTVVFAAP
ncbi:MAG: plastocyanin/azurin family copper-binding protein [Chloroflexota bacterium]|nr:plastocyanin/azurin family copper-binding protein [Chloroflexota bacterium]